MSIVPAWLADLPELISLQDACIAKLHDDGIGQWDDICPSCICLENDVLSKSLYICHMEHTLCGCITLDEKQEAEYEQVPWTHHGSRILVVRRLMVHPDHRGRGVAKQLMHFAEEKARKRRYDAVRLSVFLDNPAALALYERLGYRRAGTVRIGRGQFACFEKGLRAARSGPARTEHHPDAQRQIVPTP
jgi:GNAT superfamily N-acetyltransferase